MRRGIDDSSLSLKALYMGRSCSQRTPRLVRVCRKREGRQRQSVNAPGNYFASPGLAKMIRPASLLISLVTSTVIVRSRNSRPFSTTTIVPSSR